MRDEGKEDGEKILEGQHTVDSRWSQNGLSHLHVHVLSDLVFD